MREEKENARERERVAAATNSRTRPAAYEQTKSKRALALRRQKKSFVHSSSLLFRVLRDRQK
jgi:hypothetical protein